MSDATAVVADRPGLSYYAPAIAISRLADSLSTGDKGRALPADVVADVMELSVTRVNSGASQYSITFNNAYLSTAVDRATRSAAVSRGEGGDALAADRESAAGASPVWPRYKYNDFAFLRFGDRLRIDMHYGADGASAEAWVPMIAGPITDMEFRFEPDKGAQLKVSGIDDFSTLQDKNAKRYEMNKLSELAIVRRVLDKAGFPLKTIADPLVEYPDFVDDDGQGLQEALQAGQGYLDYLQKLADRLDFEVFLEFADVTKADSALEFHFEPWRGRAKASGDEGGKRDLFTIDAVKNLVQFQPTIKVADQYSLVTVRGRHRDPQVPDEVRGKATDEILSDELQVPSGAKALSSGPKLREVFFPNRKNEFTVQNQSNLDEVRADWLAKAVIRKKARELLTVTGTTIGLPRLRPGNHVQLVNLKSPFDGYYYLTKTVHTFGSRGLRTEFTGVRPGMEMPTADRALVGAGAQG